jgi:AcrR family transcriptional regulator
MSVSTKQRILDAAVFLFNREGVANVRLQQIADETGISVGNLAYHFKNKEAIVSSVYEYLFEELKQVLSTYLSSPSLTDFDDQLSHYYAFFGKYRFYLIDLFDVERAFPDIIAQWHEFVGKMVLQIRHRIAYGVSRGVLVPEPSKGLYDTLADNIWMTITFWIPQQVLKGQPLDESSFKSALWAQFQPYFTDKGWEEFSNVISPLFVGGDK